MKRVKFFLIGIVSALCIVGCGSQPSSSSRVIEQYEDDGSEHHEPMFITNNFGGDASSELVVQWQNIDGSTNQRVQITTPDDVDFTYAHNVEASYRKLDIDTAKVGEYDKNGVYRAEISDLEPGKQYIYRVGANDAWSDTYYHLTAEGDSSNFSFTVASDPQSPAHTEMSKTLNAANEYDEDHRFFFLAGDLVDDIGKKPAEIKSYTQAASEFNKYKIIATTQGNHDTYENNQPNNTYKFSQATIFNTFTTFPNNGFVQDDVTKSNSYYYRYNNLLFVSLNTMVTDDAYAPQAAWLRNVLDEQSDADYIVATMHIGPFQSENDSEWKEPNVRKAFLGIFSEYKVDAVFYGHDHSYGRTNPIALTGNETVNDLKIFNTTPNEDGTVFSMVGATGPKFYDLGNNSYQSNIFSVRSDARPGTFVNVQVNDDELEINAFKLSTTTDGEIIPIDSYSIPKKNR